MIDKNYYLIHDVDYDNVRIDFYKNKTFIESKVIHDYELKVYCKCLTDLGYKRIYRTEELDELAENIEKLRIQLDNLKKEIADKEKEYDEMAKLSLHNILN